ncbi:MAG: zinc ribbon domain-containing protein [Anaerolineaceae bacterium]
MARYTLVFLALLVFCLSLFQPAAVSAQAVLIDSLQIDIWPEYDRPEVLVIFHLSLSETAALPADLTLRIPASTGGPFNLAYASVNTQGETELYNLEYTTQSSGDWIEVSFSTPTRAVQLEYYDPGMQRAGEKRDFQFVWPADYTVRSMAVQVLQPLNSVDMQMNPRLGESGVFQDGRTYHRAMLGTVEAGQQVTLQIQYSKSDEVLSQDYDAVYATEDDSTFLPATLQNAWPWVLAAVGAALITVAVIWYLIPHRISPFRRGKQVPAATRVLTRRANVYCHNCGTVSTPEDVFCRMCGTKLRK